MKNLRVPAQCAHRHRARALAARAPAHRRRHARRGAVAGLAAALEVRSSKALLGNECLPNRRSCPSVRAANRWNLLHVQLLGDLVQRHPLPEHRVDLHPPCVVTSVAEAMREPDVVGGEVTSVRLESRIVVGCRLPIGTRRSLFEVATTPEAVALGHLATHVDDLAIPRKLPEDSANSQSLELLNWSFSSVRRCRWGSCLRDLLIVVHARALSPRRWRPSGHGR
jgi:hypothetical protein